MKKATYALSGTAMVITATVLSATIGGSLEIVFLILLGLVLLVASADPARASPR